MRSSCIEDSEVGQSGARARSGFIIFVDDDIYLAIDAVMQWRRGVADRAHQGTILATTEGIHPPLSIIVMDS